MKTTMFLALVFWALSMWPSLGRADDGIWIRTGAPTYLTKFNDINACYQDGIRHIFAAESSATSAIWHSTTNGANWLAPINAIGNHYYKQIIMEPDAGQNGWALVPGNKLPTGTPSMIDIPVLKYNEILLLTFSPGPPAARWRNPARCDYIWRFPKISSWLDLFDLTCHMRGQDNIYSTDLKDRFASAHLWP